MKILVVTGNHPKDGIGGAELQAYMIAKGIKDLEKSTIFCAVLSNYEKKVREKDGLEYISFNSHQNFFIRMYKFYKFLRNLRPDVVYVRCEYPFWWINLISKLLRIPALYHVSSIMRCKYLTWKEYLSWEKEKHWLKSFKRMILLNFYIFNSRFADAIICQTEEQREMMKKELNRTAKVIRSGHPVPSFLSNKNNTQFNILWIGKYWKNPEIFVELAKRFSDKSDFIFTMIGIFPHDSANPYKRLENQSSNFKFLGELPYDEVNKMLEKSHVLVNTSDYEGFSNTFIQAWMRGVPVLSIRVNPDGLLTEKKIGFLSPTVDKLEKDIMKFYIHRKFYNEYSINCYKYASQEHDIKLTSMQIWELCKKVLNEKS